MKKNLFHEAGGVTAPANTGIQIQLAVDDWVLEKLLTFDADEAELEDESDGEPDDDAEKDGPPVLLETVRPKMLRARR